MRKQGFTLIELSIVLVVIGLIIGGVMAGQSLIKNAAYRKQIAEWEKLDAGVNTFRLKYNALPGDMPNAYSFGLAASSGQNGNGDGRLVPLGSVQNFGHPAYGAMELCNFWSQLSLTNLIEQTFSACGGIVYVQNGAPFINPTLTAGATSNYVAIANCPSPCADPITASSFQNNHYIVSTVKYNNSSSQWVVIGNNHSVRPSPFTVEDMRHFDSKMDDGAALTGKFQLILSTSPFPLVSSQMTDLCNDAATSDGYKNNYSSRECHFFMKASF